jgi:uncharacterized tellurite resistance protein B-like protein
MSLISRLRDVLREIVEPDEASPADEESLTAAALLVLVARVDGSVLPVEEASLKVMLRGRFDLSEDGVERVLEAAADLDRSSDGAAAVATRILQETPERDRPALLAMAYRVAAVDGVVHEVEADLLWRIGRLLGFDEAAVAAIREDAFRNLAPERADRG